MMIGWIWLIQKATTHQQGDGIDEVWLFEFEIDNTSDIVASIKPGDRVWNARGSGINMEYYPGLIIFQHSTL